SRSLLHPFQAIYDEIHQRYLIHHFLPFNGAWSTMKVIGLAVFVGAIFTLIAVPELRKRSGYRLLLCLTAVRFLMMAVGASWRLEYYLVHVLPFYSAITGIAAAWFWTHPVRIRRVAVASVLAVYFAVQLAVAGHLMMVS